MALADNKVKIQALLAGIDALPEAGSGEAPAPVLQEKAVTPTEEAQSIAPDAGYDGLSRVNVGAIPDEYIVPSGTVNITENGEHDVREVETVNVSVPAPEITLQEKTVTPTASAQSVTPDSGYDGMSKVSVNGDSNLVPGNIKSGVPIFGVVGSYEGSGGGSSGDAEMCTFTLIDASVTGHVVDAYHASAEGWNDSYLDPHGTIVFETKRGSIVSLHIEGADMRFGWATLTGGIEEVGATTSTDGVTICMYYVSADCTFQLNR